MNWAMTTTRRSEKHSSFRIWSTLYQMFDGTRYVVDKHLTCITVHLDSQQSMQLASHERQQSNIFSPLPPGIDLKKEYVSPCKHAIMCPNWGGTGPMLAASARFWPSKGMIRHVYRVQPFSYACIFFAISPISVFVYVYTFVFVYIS